MLKLLNENLLALPFKNIIYFKHGEYTYHKVVEVSWIYFMGKIYCDKWLTSIKTVASSNSFYRKTSHYVHLYVLEQAAF